MAETEKAFDISKGEFVDVEPTEPPPAADPKEEQEEEEEEEQEDTSKDKDEEEEEQEEEELTPEQVTAKLEELGKKDEKDLSDEDKAFLKDNKKDDEPAPSLDINAQLKEKYFEEYEIESLEDLDEILESVDKIYDEYEKLKQEKGKSVFRSEQEEKIVKFLHDYPEDLLGEGLATVGTILKIDPVNISEDRALLEAFILDNPELTREEASELFEDRQAERVLNKDDFDDPAKYEKKMKLMAIEKKKEVAKAREILAKKKEELKAKATEKKKDEQEPPQAKKIDEKVVSSYSEQIEKFWKNDKGAKFDRFVFKDPKDKDLQFNIVLDSKKQDQLREFMSNFVRDPNAYDKNQKITNFDPEKLALVGTVALWGDWIFSQSVNEISNLARKVKAEQIASRSPQKKSGGAGKGTGVPSFTEQFEALAKKEAAARKRK